MPGHPRGGQRLARTFTRPAALGAIPGEVQGRRMGIRRLDSRRDALPLLSEERQARSRQSGLESRFPQIRIPGPCLEPDVSNWRHFTTIIRRSEPTLEANRPDCRQTQEHEQNAKRSTQRLKTSTDPHHTDVAANSGFRAECAWKILHELPGNGGMDRHPRRHDSGLAQRQRSAMSSRKVVIEDILCKSKRLDSICPTKKCNLVGCEDDK